LIPLGSVFHTGRGLDVFALCHRDSVMTEGINVASAFGDVGCAVRMPWSWFRKRLRSV